MTGGADFGRLSRQWAHWSGLARLREVSVTTLCEDCDVRFSSSDYAVHLRSVGGRWFVDTVDDRGQRQNDTATFSSYQLAEKYLIWIWGSAARSVLRTPILGRELYALGFASGVEAIPISEGIYELRSPDGTAMLMEPYATIFSHLMHTSEERIEQMLAADIGLEKRHTVNSSD